MIPKIFHQIWLGSQPMPEQHKVWSRTWLRFNPGWTLRLWKGQEELVLINQEEFDTARHVVEQSDILRYEIVYRFGGCYIDTDFECLRRFDWKLLTNEAFVGLERQERINNAILAAEPKHPWMEAAIQRLPLHRATHADKSVAERTGPDFLQAVTSGRRDVKIFPIHYFYSLSMKQAIEQRDENPPSLETDPLKANALKVDTATQAYARHHFALSWKKME